MAHLSAIITASRLPFLVLAPVCIIFSVASIYYFFGVFSPVFTAIILCGATLAHISVNLFNEYLDFKSGLDFKTTRTPFSGGSGALQADPSAAFHVLTAAVVSLVLTVLCGIYLLYAGFNSADGLNSALILIGLSGLSLVLLYTGPINRSPWLCFISPGLGFGFLMVFGSASSLLGYLPVELFSSALLLFLMVNNLLLLNQLPDAEADKTIGRNHIWIARGNAFATSLFLFTTLLVPLLFLVCVFLELWPTISLLALLPWALTLFSWRGAKQFGSDVTVHTRFLAMNVVATLSVPLVLSLIFVLRA